MQIVNFSIFKLQQNIVAISAFLNDNKLLTY